MGVLAAVGAYAALGTVTTSTLAIAGASLVGAAVASTELGWLGENESSTSQVADYQYLAATDKSSLEEEETLNAPELGSETASKKKTKKASFSTEIATTSTGLNTGTTPSSQVTGVQI